MFKTCDYQLPESEAAGGGRDNVTGQWKRNTERNQRGGVPGNGRRMNDGKGNMQYEL